MNLRQSISNHIYPDNTTEAYVFDLALLMPCRKFYSPGGRVLSVSSVAENSSMPGGRFTFWIVAHLIQILNCFNGRNVHINKEISALLAMLKMPSRDVMQWFTWQPKYQSRNQLNIQMRIIKSMFWGLKTYWMLRLIMVFLRSYRLQVQPFTATLTRLPLR